MSKQDAMGKKKGLEVLFLKHEPFMINGRKYTYRNLGMFDTFRILNMLKASFNMGFMESSKMVKDILRELKLLKDGDSQQEEKLVRYAFFLSPLMGIPDIEFLLLDFLQSILREIVRDDETATEKEIEVDVYDTDAFPGGTEMILFAQLAQHPSIESYKNSFIVAQSQSQKLKGLLEMVTGQKLA